MKCDQRGEMEVEMDSSIIWKIWKYGSGMRSGISGEI